MDNTNNSNSRHTDQTREARHTTPDATQHVDRVALMKEGAQKPAAGNAGDSTHQKNSAHTEDGKGLKFHDIYKDTVTGHKGDGSSDESTRAPKPGADAKHPRTEETGHHNDAQSKKPADHSKDPHANKHGEKPADKDPKKAGDQGAAKPADQPAKAADKPPSEEAQKNNKALMEQVKNGDAALVLNSAQKIDSNKPTVAFVDQFQKQGNTELKLTGTDKNPNGPSHGEFSARAAEQQGFNAYRIQSNSDQLPDKKHENFPQTLNNVADKIENGQLKMGKGDAVNVSLGHPEKDMTFDQANKFLGTKDLNAENLKEKRPEIMNRLNQISNDPSRSSDDRNLAKEAYDNNKAIDRLQDKGIHVLHAAGNDGNQRFSMDYMNASNQLGSYKPDGKPDSFSADHSLISNRGTGDGVFSVKYNGMDPMSKQPVADQKGYYQTEGKSQIRFEGSEYGSRLGNGNNGVSFDRNKFWDQGKAPAAAAPDRLDQSAFSKDVTSKDHFSNKGLTQWNPNKFSESKEQFNQGDNKNARTVPVYNNTTNALKNVTAKPESGDANNRAAWTGGTSFANINELRQMHDQMLEERNR